MAEIVDLDPTTPNPYLFHADKGAPKQIYVTGDPVVYSDVASLTAAENEGEVKTGQVFAEGKYLRSLGRSIVTVADAEPEPKKPKAKAKK